VACSCAQFLLVDHEDREIPEIKVLLYKADMVRAPSPTAL